MSVYVAGASPNVRLACRVDGPGSPVLVDSSWLVRPGDSAGVARAFELLEEYRAAEPACGWVPRDTGRARRLASVGPMTRADRGTSSSAEPTAPLEARPEWP